MFFNDGASANYEQAHNIGHVALYIGDGKVAEAGSPVGVYNLVGRNYYRVYRIIKESGSSTSNKKDKTDSDKKKNK